MWYVGVFYVVENGLVVGGVVGVEVGVVLVVVESVDDYFVVCYGVGYLGWVVDVCLYYVEVVVCC